MVWYDPRTWFEPEPPPAPPTDGPPAPMPLPTPPVTPPPPPPLPPPAPPPAPPPKPVPTPPVTPPPEEPWYDPRKYIPKEIEEAYEEAKKVIVPTITTVAKIPITIAAPIKVLPEALKIITPKILPTVKEKVVTPIVKIAPVVAETLFEPTKIHLRAVAEAIKKVEEPYIEKVVVPTTTWIGGEQAKKQVKQQKVVEKEATDVGTAFKSLQDAGLVTPKGEFIYKATDTVLDKYKGQYTITPAGEYMYKPPTLETQTIDAKWKDSIRGTTWLGTQKQLDQYNKEWEDANKIDQNKQGKFYSELERASTADTASFKKYNKEVEEYTVASETLQEIVKPSPIRQLVRGAGEIVVSLPTFPLAITRGVTTAIERPTAVPAAAVAVGLAYKELARVEPYRFVGQIAGMALIPAAKYAPIKVKMPTIKYPTGIRAVGLGLEIKRPLITIRRPIGGEVITYKPIITAITRKRLPIPKKAIVPKIKAKIPEIRVGKIPKIELERIIREPTKVEPFYIPKTPFERAIIERAVPITELPKITEALAVKRLTISSRVTPGEFKSTMHEILQYHKIPHIEKTLNTIIQTLKTQEAELYGSIIQKAAGRVVGEKGLARVPRDFDVKVTNTKAFGKAMVININKATGKDTVYLKGDHIYIRKTGDKLFDIHSKTSEIGKYSTEADFIAYGIKPGRLIKTEIGAKTITLAEQTSRKLEGAMVITTKERIIESPMMSVTGKIAPKHGGRIKDIQDFYFGEKVEIKVIRSRGHILKATRAETHLERWLDSWGGDVPSKVRQAYLKAEAVAVPELKPLLYAPPEPGVVYPSVIRDVGKYVRFTPVTTRIPKVYEAPPYKEIPYRIPTYEVYPKVKPIYPKAIPTYPVAKIREMMYRVGKKYEPRKVKYPKPVRKELPKYPVIPEILEYPIIPKIKKIKIPEYPKIAKDEYKITRIIEDKYKYIPDKITRIIEDKDIITEYKITDKIIDDHSKVIEKILKKPKKKKKPVEYPKRIMPEDFFQYGEITPIMSSEEIIAGMQKYRVQPVRRKRK